MQLLCISITPEPLAIRPCMTEPLCESQSLKLCLLKDLKSYLSYPGYVDKAKTHSLKNLPTKMKHMILFCL